MSSTVVSVASTAGVDVPDRVAFWEHYNEQMLVSLRCMSYHEKGLDAEQRNVDLGAVKLAEIHGNAHVIDRTEKHIEETPKDSIFVTHLVSGSAFFLHSHGSIRLGAGDTILYDPSRPYMFGFETDMKKVLLDIPKAALAGLDPVQLPIVRPHLEAGTTQRSAALRELMQTALAAGDAEPDVAGADNAPAIADAEALLNATVALVWPGEAAGAALCDAAKRAIEADLTDLDLSVERIARQVGVSPRHLNRLFVAIEGCTVTQYLHRARLEGARRELSDPAYLQVRVADIAARWGFSSQSHLTRAFGRQFGCRPSDIRGQQP